MNAKEGMRRLGLVAGVLGASVGSYISYDQLRTLLEQRHRYQEFQSLALSPVVRAEVLSPRDSDGPLDKLERELQAEYPSKVESNHCWLLIYRGGIRSVYRGPNGDFQAIEKDDGTVIYPGSNPPHRAYLLALVPPALGFLLPWGSLAVLTWIGTGFFQSPK